jgi:hypothetical protein
MSASNPRAKFIPYRSNHSFDRKGNILLDKPNFFMDDPQPHQGNLSPEYRAAYIQESIFGAVNVLLMMVATVVGVWMTGDRHRGDDQQGRAPECL